MRELNPKGIFADSREAILRSTTTQRSVNSQEGAILMSKRAFSLHDYEFFVAFYTSFLTLGKSNKVVTFVNYTIHYGLANVDLLKVKLK